MAVLISGCYSCGNTIVSGMSVTFQGVKVLSNVLMTVEGADKLGKLVIRIVAWTKDTVWASVGLNQLSDKLKEICRWAEVFDAFKQITNFNDNHKTMAWSAIASSISVIILRIFNVIDFLHDLHLFNKPAYVTAIVNLPYMGAFFSKVGSIPYLGVALQAKPLLVLGFVGIGFRLFDLIVNHYRIQKLELELSQNVHQLWVMRKQQLGCDAVDAHMRMQAALTGAATPSPEEVANTRRGCEATIWHNYRSALTQKNKQYTHISAEISRLVKKVQDLKGEGYFKGRAIVQIPESGLAGRAAGDVKFSAENLTLLSLSPYDIRIIFEQVLNQKEVVEASAVAAPIAAAAVKEQDATAVLQYLRTKVKMEERRWSVIAHDAQLSYDATIRGFFADLFKDIAISSELLKTSYGMIAYVSTAFALDIYKTISDVFGALKVIIEKGCPPSKLEFVAVQEEADIINSMERSSHRSAALVA